MIRTRTILRRRKRFQKMRKELARRLSKLGPSDASWPAGQLSRSPT